MTELKYIFCLVIIAAGLAGCGSVPDEKTAPATDAAYFIDKSIATPQPDTGKVVIRRDSWPMHGYRVDFYLDGRKIGSIGNGEIATVYLPVGRHLIGVYTIDNKPFREMATEISDKRTTYIHVTLSALGYGGWVVSETSH